MPEWLDCAYYNLGPHWPSVSISAASPTSASTSTGANTIIANSLPLPGLDPAGSSAESERNLRTQPTNLGLKILQTTLILRHKLSTLPEKPRWSTLPQKHKWLKLPQRHKRSTLPQRHMGPKQVISVSVKVIFLHFAPQVC